MSKKSGLLANQLDTALSIVAFLWVVYIVDLVIPGVNFGNLGIRPREAAGLWGILFAPFLHAGFQHLIANSVALSVLLILSLSYSRRQTWRAIAFIMVVGGLLVWLLGRTGTVHVGASGVVFGLITFLICSGIFRAEWRAILLAVLTLFLYGGALAGLLDRAPGVSLISHIAGAVAGMLAAWQAKGSAR